VQEDKKNKRRTGLYGGYLVSPVSTSNALSTSNHAHNR
jgi:hypothetical protein